MCPYDSNDLMVYGKGEKHDERLEKILKRCDKHDVTLHIEKCKLAPDMVMWYGNINSK